MMVKVDTPLIQGWVECKSLRLLQAHAEHPLREDIKSGLGWRGAKLPADLFKKVLGTVHEFPNMETGFVLCYKLSDKSWKVVCTEQKGTGASVHFGIDKSTPIPDGYAEVGTIHTHPNIPAFWSHTDLNDFKDTDGVYVVLGLQNGKPVATKCSITRDNVEYDCPLWDVFEEVDLQGDYDPEPEWVERIKKQSYVVKSASVNWTTVDPAELDMCRGRRAAAKMPLRYGQGCWPMFDDDESDLRSRAQPRETRDSYYYSLCGKKSKEPSFLSQLLDMLLNTYTWGDLIEELRDKAVDTAANVLFYTYGDDMSFYDDAASDLYEHMDSLLGDGFQDETVEIIKELNAKLRKSKMLNRLQLVLSPAESLDDSQEEEMEETNA